MIVQLPGLTVAVGMSKCDGLPLVQLALTFCGPHDTGAVTCRFWIVTEVVEFATILNGVANLTSPHALSRPPVKVAPVMVAVPSALTVPVKLAVQARVGKPGADMLVEPVALKVPVGVNEEAKAGPDIAMHATAAKSAPIFFMIILSRLSFWYAFSGRYFPDRIDARGSQAGGSRDRESDPI